MLKEIKSKLFELCYGLRAITETNFIVEDVETSSYLIISTMNSEETIKTSVYVWLKDGEYVDSIWLLRQAYKEEDYELTETNWYKRLLSEIKYEFPNDKIIVKNELVIKPEEIITYDLEDDQDLVIPIEDFDFEEDEFDPLEFENTNNLDFCNFISPIKFAGGGKPKDMKEIIEEQIAKGERDPLTQEDLKKREQEFVDSFRKYLGDDITIENNGEVIYDSNSKDEKIEIKEYTLDNAYNDTLKVIYQCYLGIIDTQDYINSMNEILEKVNDDFMLRDVLETVLVEGNFNLKQIADDYTKSLNNYKETNLTWNEILDTVEDGRYKELKLVVHTELEECNEVLNLDPVNIPDEEELKLDLETIEYVENTEDDLVLDVELDLDLEPINVEEDLDQLFDDLKL